MSHTLARLARCTDRLDELEEEIRAERRRRAELARQALDEGATYRQVAHAARRRPSTVAAMVAEAR